MKRAVVSVLALMSIGLFAAGCGGGGEGGGGGGPLSKGDYESQMQALQEKLTSVADNLADLNPSSIEDSASALGTIADLFDEAAKGLAEIDAPGEVADAHAALEEGARQAAGTFRELGDKIRDADLAEVPQLLSSLNESLEETLGPLQEAIDEIKEGGFDIGGDE